MIIPINKNNKRIHGIYYEEDNKCLIFFFDAFNEKEDMYCHDIVLYDNKQELNVDIMQVNIFGKNVSYFIGRCKSEHLHNIIDCLNQAEQLALNLNNTQFKEGYKHFKKLIEVADFMS